MVNRADDATSLEQSQLWLNFPLLLFLYLGVSGLAALAHELVLWTQERVSPPVLVRCLSS